MAQEQRSSGIRILSVVWFKILPAHYGGQKGTALFNAHLAVEADDLLCICSRSNIPESSFKVQNILPISKWQFLNPFCWYKIYKAAKDFSATHVILEYPYYGIAGYLLKKLSGLTLIVHNHNIEYIRFKQLQKWWWGLLYHFERWTHRQADLSIFKTTQEQTLAIKMFNLDEENCMTIPYGVKNLLVVDRLKNKEIIAARHDISPDEKIILFAGTIDYEPNARAVNWIITKLLPYLTDHVSIPYKILICGRNQLQKYQYLKELRHPNLLYAGEVPDIETYFVAADVFINPVQETTGIQTKIIDALSCHCTVVTTQSAATGIPLELCGEKLLLVQSLNESTFTEKIIEALKVNSETPAAFLNYFNWEKSVKRLMNYLRK
ncbi:MAG TPA: glycosyltransferase family 4 protein [Flavisolibacter sp.]|nr:glycosyltransferase family 4 protein [Flavisolibacter sp.]